MNDDNKFNCTVAGSGGVGLAGLLTVAFVVLKLVGVINWSWLWVLSPLWISTGIALIFCIIAIVIFAVVMFRKMG